MVPNNNNLYLESAPLYDLDRWPLELLKKEIPFCNKYPAGPTSSVLDLACGTGRISIAFAEHGFDVVGLDLSDAMLAQFQKKKTRLPPEVRDRLVIVKGDMADFNLGRKFPLIVLLWRSFQCLLTEREQRGCLRCVYEHLAENGVFIMDVFKGRRDMEQKWTYAEKTSSFIDEKTGWNVIKRHKGTTDVKAQLIHCDVHFTATGADIGTIEANDPYCVKYHLPHQLRKLLRSERFFIQDEFGDYDERPLRSGDEMIAVCRRKADVGLVGRFVNGNWIKRSPIVSLAGRVKRKLGELVGMAHVMTCVSSWDVELLIFGSEGGQWILATL